jgi:shikimate 5-dehydrogenase
LHKATNSTKFQLLVNCTPVGATTLPVQPAKLPDFTKLLDLPYRNKPTELIKFCQKKSLAFISGQKFWQWQAEEQLHAFVKELKGKL